MMDNHTIEDEKPNWGNFSANLVNFVRLLRRLDIPVSSTQLFSFAEGLVHIDISRKDDFYHTSRAFLLHDVDQQELFNLAFDAFWSRYIKEMVELSGSQHENQEPISGDVETNHLLNNSLSENQFEEDEFQESAIHDLELKPIYSSNEILYRKDFSELSLDELRRAKDLINDMVWQLEQRRTRRKVRSVKTTDKLDFRRLFRRNIMYGGEIVKLEWRRRKLKPRPIVVLSDISGSMERYSKIFLYFLYAMVQRARRIETFVFGTRLTRITPALRKTNIELVLGELSNNVLDWSGGTRIGESLKEFNYLWSRRVTSQEALLIIISDGWDRGDIALLDKEIGRLQRSVHRLIWLNPLAGSPDYQPLVKGIQTVLPYVDDFYPLNNLNNLESLAERLGTLD